MEEETLANYLTKEISDGNVNDNNALKVFKEVATKLMSEYAIKK